MVLYIEKGIYGWKLVVYFNANTINWEVPDVTTVLAGFELYSIFNFRFLTIFYEAINCTFGSMNTARLAIFLSPNVLLEYNKYCDEKKKLFHLWGFGFKYNNSNVKSEF